MMKPICRIKLENGHIQITVEYSIFFGLIKKRVKFTSDRAITGRHRNWVKEPNKTLVSDYMSFQLDEWNTFL